MGRPRTAYPKRSRTLVRPTGSGRMFPVVAIAPTALSELRHNVDVHRRRRRIVGDRTGAGLARPTAIKGRRRRRLRPVRRRQDFQPPISRTPAGRGEKAAPCGRGFALVIVRIDIRTKGQRKHQRPVDHRRVHHVGARETEFALDHGVGHIDAVDRHRYAGLSWNDDHRSTLGERRQGTHGKKQRRLDEPHEASAKERNRPVVVRRIVL